jgi:hypothetical protein
MESDTTVPGDKLHDPVETPAGKRESTPVLRVCQYTCNGAISNPPLSHWKRTCAYSFHSRSSDLLRYQVSGSRTDFEDTRSRYVGVP